jgi:hypothetical protein
MITGFVNVEFEPIIPLSIRRADGKVFTQDAIAINKNVEEYQFLLHKPSTFACRC